MTDVLFLLAFPFVWLAVCHGLSRMGGWHQLAGRFSTQQPFDGPKHNFVSGNMQAGGMQMSYSSCLVIGGDERGLYLSILPLFKPGHPPLFVPWREVRVGERKRFSLMEVLELHVGGPGGATLQLYAKTADQVLAKRPVSA